jgi:bacillithiol biosynthesis cysteine-adding enzyme BshC
LKDETSALRHDSARRERVAAILERQNRAWGASQRTLENIARLRNGASAVVTGQQVGLFGGPLFSLFKALTTVKLANQASSAGYDSVPVFWLASADHDLAEISHVSILAADGSLQKLVATTHGAQDAPVGAVTFGPEIEPIVDAAVALLGDSEVTSFLRESYRPGENFGSSFARLFARLFADWGVVLLDASDPELQQTVQPIYLAAIERAPELDDALLARGKELEAAGYHQQVKVTPSSTLLFMLRNGARTPIHRRSTGGVAGTDFLVGDETVPQVDMLRRIAAEPHLFSANVLLRPVVQDYLLPTLAYVGGAAEVAYFGQGGVVYEALLGRVTPILPRFSATIVEANLDILERYRLTVPDIFAAPKRRGEPSKAYAASRPPIAFTRLRLLQKSLAAIQHSRASGQAHWVRRQRWVQDAAPAEQPGRGGARRAAQSVLGRHAELLSTPYPHQDVAGARGWRIYFTATRRSASKRSLRRDPYDCLITRLFA